MATGFITHNDYLKHNNGPFHPEQPRRLHAISEAIGRYDALSVLRCVEPRMATEEEVLRVHDAVYVDEVRRLSERGGGSLDVDTPVGPESYRIARLSAGGSLRAVEAVLEGRYDNIFVAARPPGHHACPDQGMGFCLFNNVAIAARQALALGLERVFILDWDVHHGNGTQNAFYHEPRVLFCSLHQTDWYPFTGEANETGANGAEGTNLNLPLRAGRRDHDYLALLDEVVAPAVRTFQPELILVSAGSDIHVRDPLGEMRLTSGCFWELTRRVMDLADELCGSRLVVVLEGGYDLPALGESTVNILHALLGLGQPEM